MYSQLTPEKLVQRLPLFATPVLVLLLAGCSSSTQCDCVPIQVIVFGTVSGTTAPTSVEVRLSEGQCRDGELPIDGIGTAQREQNGTYQVSIARPRLGPVCVVATATTLEAPIVTATRRLGTTITGTTVGDPQRIQADLTFGNP